MSKAIKFYKRKDDLILQYSPQFGTENVLQELYKSGQYTIQNTFTVKPNILVDRSDRDDYVDRSEFTLEFVIATLANDYYVFDKDVLDVEINLKIHSSFSIDRSTFLANDYISIFSKIDEIVLEDDFIVGGESIDSIGYISEDEFHHLIKQFPNTYEKKIYAQARVSSLLKDRFGIRKDYESRFKEYLNKKLTSQRGTKLLPAISDYELQKYSVLHEHLTEMLNDETGYSELQWQNVIIEFILILFPKYLYAFPEAPVLDFYYKNVRSVDFILIDFDGNADIIEIKKPFNNGLVTKYGYRDNHIPLLSRIKVGSMTHTLAYRQ